MEGRQLTEYGPADSFGHAQGQRRRSARLRDPGTSGHETLASELTYDLRSGDPDAVDSIVGITFANVAMNLIADGVSGRMVAIRGGKYSHSPLPDPNQGPRSIDIASMYNTTATAHLHQSAGLPSSSAFPLPRIPRSFGSRSPRERHEGPGFHRGLHPPRTDIGDWPFDK